MQVFNPLIKLLNRIWTVLNWNTQKSKHISRKRNFVLPIGPRKFSQKTWERHWSHKHFILQRSQGVLDCPYQRASTKKGIVAWYSTVSFQIVLGGWRTELCFMTTVLVDLPTLQNGSHRPSSPKPFPTFYFLLCSVAISIKNSSPVRS